MCHAAVFCTGCFGQTHAHDVFPPQILRSDERFCIVAATLRRHAYPQDHTQLALGTCRQRHCVHLSSVTSRLPPTRTTPCRRSMWGRPVVEVGIQPAKAAPRRCRTCCSDRVSSQSTSRSSERRRRSGDARRLLEGTVRNARRTHRRRAQRSFSGSICDASARRVTANELLVSTGWGHWGGGWGSYAEGEFNPGDSGAGRRRRLWVAG